MERRLSDLLSLVLPTAEIERIVRWIGEQLERYRQLLGHFHTTEQASCLEASSERGDVQGSE